MNNILLNDVQLDEKINNLLTRKNKFYKGEPARMAQKNIAINRVNNTATINF